AAGVRRVVEGAREAGAGMQAAQPAQLQSDDAAAGDPATRPAGRRRRYLCAGLSIARQGVPSGETSTGSTVLSAITRARMMVPLREFFTEMTSPRRPDCSASAGTCTSTPVLRATMVT